MKRDEGSSILKSVAMGAAGTLAGVRTPHALLLLEYVILRLHAGSVPTHAHPLSFRIAAWPRCVFCGWSDRGHGFTSVVLVFLSVCMEEGRLHLFVCLFFPKYRLSEWCVLWKPTTHDAQLTATPAAPPRRRVSFILESNKQHGGANWLQWWFLWTTEAVPKAAATRAVASFVVRGAPHRCTSA